MCVCMTLLVCMVGVAAVEDTQSGVSEEGEHTGEREREKAVESSLPAMLRHRFVMLDFML